VICARVLHGTSFSIPLPSHSHKHLSRSRPTPIKLKSCSRSTESRSHSIPVAAVPVLIPILHSHCVPQNEWTKSVFSSLTWCDISWHTNQTSDIQITNSTHRTRDKDCGQHSTPVAGVSQTGGGQSTRCFGPQRVRRTPNSAPTDAECGRSQ